MSTTDELIAELTQRDIKYKNLGDLTFWIDESDVKWCTQEQPSGALHLQAITLLNPEQAIEATLMRKPDNAAMVKLHDRMNVALYEYEHAQGIERHNGDGKVVVPFVDEMHGLLEEAATLKQGTCHNINASWPSLFECDACGYSNDDTYCGSESHFNFCPNCGRKVVNNG